MKTNEVFLNLITWHHYLTSPWRRYSSKIVNTVDTLILDPTEVILITDAVGITTTNAYHTKSVGVFYNDNVIDHEILTDSVGEWMDY